MKNDIFSLLIWYFGGFVISREALTAQDATVWPGFAADVR